MYRPSISPEAEDRITLYVDNYNKRNSAINNLIKSIIDEDGNEKEVARLLLDDDMRDRDWVNRLESYCDEEDLDEGEVLDQILTSVIDEGGDANIQFKERLDL